MIKAELCANLTEKTNLSKADAEHAARSGSNPQIGAIIHIPASKAVTFTAGKVLKGAVK